MKPDNRNKGYKYTKLKVMQIANRFEFAEMEDLCRYTDSHNLREVYVLLNASNEAEHFAIMYNNSLLQYASNGFRSIEDYVSAKTCSFPDADSYYAATGLGYQCYEDYVMVTEAGISDKTLFDKIKDGGFVSGFTDYAAPGNNIPSDSRSNQPANPYQLYQLALQCGFSDYSTFKTALSKGFADRETYDLAVSYGFACHADYIDAKSRGFKTHAEYAEANELNVRDAKEMGLRNDLLCVSCTGCTFDQQLLLVLLSKVEQGKKISINKLADVFDRSLQEYRYADTGELPAWFTTSFTGTPSITSFLINNNEVKNYGHYDGDGEYFEIKLLQHRKVVIDGSNVAHNSNGNKGSKPAIQNILTLAKYLQGKGFTDITIIADASLRHKISDPENLPELKKIAGYLEAPGECPADIFLIKHVKNNRCLLVSNDTFRDWKTIDSWVAENINFYRLSFMIKGTEVLMPDIK